MKNKLHKQSGNLSLLSPRRIRVLILLFSDLLCYSGILTGLLWIWGLFGCSMCGRDVYGCSLAFVLLFLFFNALFRCYHGSFFYPGNTLNRIEELRRLSFSLMLAYGLSFAYLLLNKKAGGYELTFLLFSMLLTILLLPICRFGSRYIMRKCRIGQIKVLIAGCGQTGQAVCSELQKSCFYGFDIAGYLDDDPAIQGRSIGGCPVLGKLAAARRIARTLQVDYIICCLPVTVVSRVFRHYSRIFQHLMFIVDNQILPISWLYPVSVGLYGGFEVRNQLLLIFPRFVKTLQEILISLCTVIFLLPLFSFLAILVKLSSPGPVFYSASRLGQNGRKIKVLKFRTMYFDAESRLEQMLEEDPALKVEWSKNFKLQNDPRITPIGRFLRKTSLDELPQFWNVLTGEMAVIGPRPIVENEVKYFGNDYELRKRVKPGITGLWQVNGRSETDYQNRVMLDMYYIMNWSVWMDYYIFLKTILVVLSRRGAF